MSKTTEQLNEIKRIRKSLNEKYEGKFGSPYYDIAMRWLNEQEKYLKQNAQTVIVTSSITEINRQLKELNDKENNDYHDIINDFQSFLN